MKEQAKNKRRYEQPKQRKPVVQVELGSGAEICEYGSVTEAAIATGADPSAIVACCKGRSRTTKGYAWRYKGVKL